MEDIAHALFYCPEISHWWQLFLPQVQHAPPRLDFLRLVEWFLDYGGSEVLPKLFTIAWSLWNMRNKRAFEETTVSPKVKIEKVLSCLHFFMDCFKAPTSELPKLGWLPPPTGEYKLNVDGALFFDHQIARVGAILRDEYGDPIVTASMRVSTLMQPGKC